MVKQFEFVSLVITANLNDAGRSSDHIYST